MRGPSSSPSSPPGRPRPAWGDQPRSDQPRSDPPGRGAGWGRSGRASASPVDEPGLDDTGLEEAGLDEPDAGAGPGAEEAGAADAGREGPGPLEAGDDVEPGPGGSAGASRPDEAAPDGDVDAASAALAALSAERDEYLDALRRLQADFENYRKRMAKQQGDQVQRAAESLVTKLLPVLDTVDLALAHAAGQAGTPGDPAGAGPGSAAAHAADLGLGTGPGASPAGPGASAAGPGRPPAGRPSPGDVAALAQISAALTDVLGREGLERIDPPGGPFDPTEHDAVMHDPDGDGDAGPEVTEVLRAGYRWKGRVLRPAMVKVRG